MGLELRYQALPNGCGLTELATRLTREGSSYASHLVFVTFYLSAIARKDDEGARRVVAYHQKHLSDPVWDWCREAVAKYPGLEKRSLYVGKHFNWLIFLLSPEARKRTRWPRPSPLDPRSWNDPPTEFEESIDRTLFTPAEIAPGLSGVHGGKIGLLDHHTVGEMAILASSLEDATVAQYLRECIANGNVPEWDLDRHVEMFQEFRAFFVETANANESALMIHD